MQGFFSKVLAGVTIALIIALGVVDYLTGWIRSIVPLLFQLPSASWEWLTSKNLVSNWIIVFLFLLALPTVVFLIILLFAVSRRKNTNEEDAIKYREDIFEGIRWRWKWSGNVPFDFKFFCPKCDCILEHLFRGIPDYNEHITLRCPSCGYEKEFDGSLKYLISRVQKLVEHKQRMEQQVRSVAQR